MHNQITTESCVRLSKLSFSCFVVVVVPIAEDWKLQKLIPNFPARKGKKKIESDLVCLSACHLDFLFCMAVTEKFAHFHVNWQRFTK